MKIHKATRAKFSEQAVVVAGEGANVGAVAIGGLRSGNEIFLPPRSALNLLTTYCHEVGHVIGDSLSFQAELVEGEEAEVLSIDEVKARETCIELTEEEIDYLRNHIFSTQYTQFTPITSSIANKLLGNYYMCLQRGNLILIQSFFTW